MHNPPRILIVDDNETNRDILQTRLEMHGYDLKQAADGEEAIAAAKEHLPDLILLDVMMPKLDGIEVCKRLRADTSLPFMPIILCTAKADTKDVVAGLEAGADEYLTKPIDQMALVARVKSVLRLKALHDQVSAQASELAGLNKGLEQRVAEQLGEIERMSRLRRFLPPQVADLIVSSGSEKRAGKPSPRDHRAVLRPARLHRLFRKLRPGRRDDAAARVPRGDRRHHPQAQRHARALRRRRRHGDLQRSGAGREPGAQGGADGAGNARRRSAACSHKWRRLGHDLGFGIGIAHGYATLGTIGFEGRFDYAAIGTVSNVASRLCDEAASGQILIAPRVHMAIEEHVTVEPAGEFELKGIRRPMPVVNVIDLAAPPAAKEA